MKPHYRLHFHWFDGKTPLWWVTCDWPFSGPATTGGFYDPSLAIKHARYL